MQTQQTNLLIGKKPVGTFAYIGSTFGMEDFYWSFIQMMALSHEYFLPSGTYIHPERSTISGQIQARNELVIKMQGDWLLQIDSDHKFDPDLAFQLLQIFEGQKLDVLCGFYTYKNAPYNPVLYKYFDGAYKNIVTWGTKDQNVKLLPIDSAGAGCLLVRRSVFDRIRAEFNEMPFSPHAPFHTDDFSFFEKCRKLGIKCWCAPHIECQHMSITGVGLDDFDSSCAPAGVTVMQDAMA